jgi:hypothetical protein
MSWAGITSLPENTGWYIQDGGKGNLFLSKCLQHLHVVLKDKPETVKVIPGAGHGIYDIIQENIYIFMI